MRGMPAIFHEHGNLTDTLEEIGRDRSTAELAQTPRERGIGPDEFAIGTVKRLHESKANHVRIETAARVLRDRPQARFFLVGEGPLLGELASLAAQPGLGDRFVTGFRRDVPATVSAFDLSVFPSLWEGTPLSMGKPIVATDANGLLDVLTPGHDAVIVPRRDAPAKKIVRAIDHPEDRVRLGAAARLATRRYDIRVFVRKMKRVYRLLYQTSQATRRTGILAADVSFLTSEAPA